jgi:hypothetical protein
LSQIFISYRREDSRTISGRIYDRLSDAWGEENLFKDVDDILPGADFPDRLRDAANACNVMLVIIGKEWLNIHDKQGNRRLDNPNDWVRIEVETGLRREILVVPVLVHDASMPQAEDLPPSLVRLASKQAVVVREDPDFRSDIRRLNDKLKRSVKVESTAKSFQEHELVALIEALIPSKQDQIKLEKLIRSKAEQTYKVFTSDEFLQHRQEFIPPLLYPSQDNSGMYSDVLAYYFDACAPALMGVASLTWWGNEGQENFVVDTLNLWIAFAGEDEFPPRQGMWGYFPALFGIYVSGILATWRNKWKFLQSILFEPRVRIQGQFDKQNASLREILSFRLLSPFFDGTRHKLLCALSNELYKDLRPLFQSYLPIESDYEFAFDLFETILALTYLHSDSRANSGGLWMPPHTAIWFDRSWCDIYSFWSKQGMQLPTSDLLQVGFFDKNPGALEATLKKYDEQVERYRDHHPFRPQPNYTKAYKDGRQKALSSQT